MRQRSGMYLGASQGAMTPEVAVGEYQHDPDCDTTRHTSNDVQTAGYTANGKDGCQRKRKQPATRPNDPHSYFVQMTSSISLARSANRPAGEARRRRHRSSVSNFPILSAKRCGAAQESENTDAITSSSERS
jgi:hypothetical protein